MNIIIFLSVCIIIVSCIILIHFNVGKPKSCQNKDTVDMFHDGKITPESFDVYLINLGRNIDRLNRFIEQYKKSDLSFKNMFRFEAVDGRSINIKDYVSTRAYDEIQSAEKTGYRTKHYQLTPGGVGCYLSHQNLFKLISESDKEFGIIFEDDSIIDPHVYEKLSDVLLEIPPDWDILLLGCYCIKCLQYQKYKDIDRFFQLHGYVVNKESAKKINNYLSKIQIEAQIDTVLSNMAVEKIIKIYCLNDTLVKQDNTFPTTIQLPINYKSGEDPYEVIKN